MAQALTSRRAAERLHTLHLPSHSDSFHETMLKKDDLYSFQFLRGDGSGPFPCYLCKLGGMNPADRLGGNCPLDHLDHGQNVICAS